MKKAGLHFVSAVCVCFALAVCVVFGQTADDDKKTTITQFEKVTLCQLAGDRGSFNRKPVELTAFVSHGFEDSLIFESECGERFSGIWMEYGGTASTATMYCCGFTPTPTRPNVLTVEGLKLPLVENDDFKTLNKLLKMDGGRIVRATLRGTFFSGKPDPYGNGKKNSWGGYGHMGCCSLFVIQEVVSVLPQDVKDLDYGSSIDQPDLTREGCGNYRIHDGEDWKTLLVQQQNADTGTDTWRYDHPEKVAIEALAELANKPPAKIRLAGIKNVPGRIVYYWRPHGRKGVRYMVVINRSYSLSLHAKDPAKTIWAVAQLYSVCE